jgi:hypothetical protein
VLFLTIHIINFNILYFFYLLLFLLLYILRRPFSARKLQHEIIITILTLLKTFHILYYLLQLYPFLPFLIQHTLFCCYQLLIFTRLSIFQFLCLWRKVISNFWSFWYFLLRYDLKSAQFSLRQNLYIHIVILTI